MCSQTSAAILDRPIGCGNSYGLGSQLYLVIDDVWCLLADRLRAVLYSGCFSPTWPVAELQWLSQAEAAGLEIEERLGAERLSVSFLNAIEVQTWC